MISLIKNEVKGCLGCNACRYGKPCIQKDAFNELVPKIKAADCIVFASPLYFWTLSSRIKAFIERFYCIAEEDPNPPFGRYEKYPVKDCALLMTSADDFFWTFEQAVSYLSLIHIFHQYNTAPVDLSVEKLVGYGRTPYHTMGLSPDPREDKEKIHRAMEITHT